MGTIQKSVATLRISGDDLVPAKVSNLLACNPTWSSRQGETSVYPRTGRERTAESGMWILECADRDPQNLEQQIDELLGKLTADIEAWRAVCNRYQVYFFCGLFMGSENEGLTISPTSLVALGRRGIELTLDVYALF